MSRGSRDHSKKGAFTGGIILLGIGLIFFLSNLNIIPDIGDSWPLFLIVIGIAMLYGAYRDRSHNHPDLTGGPGDSPT